MNTDKTGSTTQGHGLWPLAQTCSFAVGAACAGVAAVLVTGMLTARLFEWYLWLWIGPAVGGAASLLARPFAKRVSGRWWPSCVGATVGGLFGAFMAAASIETHQGLSWLEYGALFGFGSSTCVAAVTATGAYAAGAALHAVTLPRKETTMKMVTILVVLISWAGTAGAKDAEKQDDKQNILGTWKYVSFIESGVKRDVPAGMRVVITKELLTVRRPGQDSTGMRYKLDPSKDPKQIDFVVELDPGHPIRQPGIYELKGNRLRIHSAAAGTPRPKDFDAAKGETGGVWVLERLPADKEGT